MTAIEPGRRQPDGIKPWRPTYTEKEASNFGVGKAMFHRVVLWARTVAEYHGQLNTPRTAWEPTHTHTEQLVGPYVDAGAK